MRIPWMLAHPVDAVTAYGPSLLPLPHPDRRFVIYTRGRTGSELLISLLRCHRGIVCDSEILGSDVRSPWRWVDGRAKRARLDGADAYGFKLLFTDLTEGQRMQDPAAFLRRLSDAGYLIVLLERNNMLRQAVSWNQAQGRQTHYRSDDQWRSSYQPIRMEPEKVLTMMVLADEVASQQRAHVQGLPHVTVTYEEDLADPARHQAAADRIFRSLGLPPQTVTTPLVRSSPPRLRDALANYDELAGLLARTRYACYLDEEEAEQPDAYAR